MTNTMNAWPNGKKLAVTVTVMFEAWSEGAAPTYSVQTTHLKPGSVDHAGKAWSSYGGRVGVWRILHTFDRLGVPATFFPNARCAEIYPDAVKEIARAGHDVAAHGYTQDGLLAYMTLDQQRATIRRCRDILGETTGHTPQGWISPVLAFTPETVDLLVQEGYKWHGDVTYIDLPHRIMTKHGPLAAIPSSDFTDNRVLRSSPRDLYDVYAGTFDYLLQHEPLAHLGLTLHCHFGGRPMVIAVFDEIIRRIQASPDVWFAKHSELAQWALGSGVDEHSYRARYLAAPNAN